MTTRMLSAFLLLSFCCTLFACGDDDDDSQSTPNEENLVLSEGNYTGQWSSTTQTASFNNLAISARISEENTGKFEGAFFISGNFTSCCNSGADDGAITFTVDEENIMDFVWDDIIPNCTGTFTGTGVITAENKLRIEFIGTDCDGDHTGTITLAK